MIHTFIGLIVGLIIGLTGAGGALISIPLFLVLLNATLKEATVLSLVAVMLGAIVNLFGQKHKMDIKLVISFVGFGALANFLVLPYKSFVSDLVIAALLIMIAIYSVWSIWKNRPILTVKLPESSFFKLLFTGLFLGVITTFTGLGGGVLLVPILIRAFGKSYEEAMPTSLATIFSISLISFLLQIKSGTNLISFAEVGFIAFGTVVAFILLGFALNNLPSQKIIILRKVVFSLVTLYSIVSIVLNIS